MFWAKMKLAAGVLAAVAVAGAGGTVLAVRTVAQEKTVAAEAAPPEIPVQKFSRLLATIKPSPAEFAWRHDIPWLLSLQESREKAAAEGKPLLIWNAADGSPLGPV